MSDRYIAEENSVYETDRKYYTIIPNMILDSGLSIYAVRLYCQLKRIAGESGKCWMSTRNLSEKCDISIGEISKSKKELEEKGFIKITNKKFSKGIYHEIEIVDIWLKNIEQYTKRSPHEQPASCSPHEQDRSPHERKNNPVNNNPVNASYTDDTENAPEAELIRTNIYASEEISTPARKNGDNMNKEEYIAATKNSLAKGLNSALIGYAHYPEDVRPVIERMERDWHFRAPARKSKKGSQYSFWIESCREIIDACGEFGISVLDALHKDWMAHIESHHGLAPFNIYSPKSLITTVAGKAVLMRNGNQPMVWDKVKSQERQSVLDI